MGSFLKKTWTTLAATLVSASTLQASGTAGACDVNCKPSNGASSYGYAYNPPVEVENRWSSEVEYLYWKPFQEGIAYGVSADIDLEGPIFVGEPLKRLPLIKKGGRGAGHAHLKEPAFKWDSGFRFGVGYRLPGDTWDAGLSYTQYSSHTASSIERKLEKRALEMSRGEVCLPTYSTLLNRGDLKVLPDRTFVHHDWKVNFNQIDLELSRQFAVGESLSLRPHAGLRALFIDQRYNLNNLITEVEEVVPPEEDPTIPADPESKVKRAIATFAEDVKMNNDFKGLGIQAGFDFDFAITSELSLFSGFGGSVSYGRFKVLQAFSANVERETEDLEVFEELTGDGSLNGSREALLANADLGLGLRWSQKINCEKQRLTVKLGWENHLFFGYNNFRAIAGTVMTGLSVNNPTGNLSFHGFSLSAALDF